MSVETKESLKFYKYLCQKIGSEEVVRIRRLAMTINDIGQRIKTITSGSQGEGLDLKGSDLDIMIIDPCFKVFESYQDVEDNNLFFLRFNIDNKEKIITLLTNLYGQGINCFASSETLQDYQSQSNEFTEYLVNRNSRFVQQLMPTFCSIRSNGRADRVLRLLYNFLHSSRTVLCRVLFALQISIASMLVPEETQYSNTSGNKHHYFRYHLHDISSCRQSLQRLKHDHWTFSEGGSIVFEPESLNTMIFWGICYQLMGEKYLAKETFRVAAKQDKYNASSAASRLSSRTFIYM
ncbi:unnamed protein product [Mytilus edulis]|uniref:Uncharacterized protein n=1 Tax=Mytilus edulis TaxID=6550 RepID=A0A8S3S988_MYTED|nr:unnamed protein product [Mytilus edulis]